ncbi:MAG: preprotein translocase subunit SecG [Patescibacteria group bacterium]|nr:preprotein translocase subunit SecG [Patescibacteria group bacterium]
MILTIFQIVIAVLLIGAILLQMQGSGLSTAFGGSGEFYRSKRSVEKLLVWVTIILATLFAVLSIIQLVPR